MASPESSKMSSEEWSTKPLHGRASTINYVRMSNTWPTANAAGVSRTGAEARGWTGFRGSSDEGESQKAGAEQGNPTGSQGKEAVGNEISISHDTPSDSHTLPN
jgi:hypothetical protein